MRHKDTLLASLDEFKINGINHGKDGIKHVLAFQDCIGHSTEQELQEFEQDLSVNGRRIFFWALCSCCDYDTFSQILASTVCLRKINKVLEKEESILADRHDKLRQREQTFEECKKPIHKRLASLERALKAATKDKRLWRDDFHAMQKENKRIAKENKRLQHEAESFRQIKRLLTD